MNMSDVVLTRVVFWKICKSLLDEIDVHVDVTNLFDARGHTLLTL